MTSKLFVGNLPYQATDENLREIFSQYGAVRSARIVRDRETGLSRGFGFVEMGVEEEADTCVSDLNNADYDGRRIVVSKARENNNRRRV